MNIKLPTGSRNEWSVVFVQAQGLQPSPSAGKPKQKAQQPTMSPIGVTKTGVDPLQSPSNFLDDTLNCWRLWFFLLEMTLAPPGHTALAQGTVLGASRFHQVAGPTVRHVEDLLVPLAGSTKCHR